MFIPKASVVSLVERLNTLDKLSRKKTLTEEDAKVYPTGLLSAVRSVLATLRKLK